LTEDITFDNAPSPQNPPIHRDVIIECRVSAEPKADVSWRFRNRNIEPSTLAFVSFDRVCYFRSTMRDWHSCSVMEDCI